MYVSLIPPISVNVYVVDDAMVCEQLVTAGIITLLVDTVDVHDKSSTYLSAVPDARVSRILTYILVRDNAPKFNVYCAYDAPGVTVPLDVQEVAFVDVSIVN